MFVSMASLTFIHLGSHIGLTTVPSFQGLVNLKALSLAGLLHVQALSSFTFTPRLERLDLFAMMSLSTLPDLAPLSRLIHLAVVAGVPICCNGFLGSACNLSHPYCRDATCLDQTSDPHVSKTTRQLLQRFADSVCVVDQAQGTAGGNGGPGQGQLNICHNVAYRQCPPDASGVIGICVSMHMTVIQCQYLNASVVARKMQIERKVGAPCDPLEESWLGCH